MLRFDFFVNVIKLCKLAIIKFLIVGYQLSYEVSWVCKDFKFPSFHQYVDSVAEEDTNNGRQVVVR
jgi:hypothetical protein